MTHNNAIAEEQRFADAAYAVLDADRASYTDLLRDVRAAGAQGTPGARSERDSFASHYEDTLLRLRNVEDRLVLGRLDSRAHTQEQAYSDGLDSKASENTAGNTASQIITHHIGRITLRDENQNILLTDWRAPQSEPFYQATAAHPGNVVRRRHIQTRFRRVTSVEDELLSDLPAGGEDLNLTGEGALMAAMSAARDGKMGDIVATIQAEQDRIIRATDRGVLVVQGGPGTGKTAVALHRAAYLLYTYRARLERSGVLIIGPSRAFLRYIDQVLPSLGESDVVFSTIDHLVPGVTPQGIDNSQVRRLKGKEIWAKIAQRAVRTSLERRAKHPHFFKINGIAITMTPNDVAQAQSRARKSEQPHNDAREIYAKYLVRTLAQRVASKQNTDLDNSPWIIADVASDPDVRRAVNRYWLPASASWLLNHILSHADLFEEVAPEFSADERNMLWRPTSSSITSSDIPIIDELLDHLGDVMSDDDRHRARQAHAEREEFERYVSATMQSMNLGSGIVRDSDLARYVSDTGANESLAERAQYDRLWTYGHVVVDEAQELTPMEWRMVMRRNPSRSMTVVGDLDQRRSGSPREGWISFLGPIAKYARVEELTVSYRTPSSILDKAITIMAALGSPVHEIRGARDLPSAYRFLRTGLGSMQDETEQSSTNQNSLLKAVLDDALLASLNLLDTEYGKGHGIVAVITTDQHLSKVSAYVRDFAEAQQRTFSLGDEGGAQLQAMQARDAKGLEYDAVIIVHPQAVYDGAPGDLYVAMTRATRSLIVVGSAQEEKLFGI